MILIDKFNNISSDKKMKQTSDTETNDSQRIFLHPMRKKSDCLPSSLLKELSYDDDDDCTEEELYEFTPIQMRQCNNPNNNINNKSNFKQRRRSSSLDNLKLLIHSGKLTKPINHVKFAENIIANPSTISFPLSNSLNTPIATTHQVSSNSQPKKQVQPRTKRSENNLAREPMFNGSPVFGPIHQPINKKYSGQCIRREFIDPDMLDSNQTFDDFLKNSGEKLGSIMKTSIGSRFLQKMIDQITPKNIDTIFSLLHGENDISNVICDNYGNYFMQKIITKCNLDQRLFLFKELKAKFLIVANDISGTHCLQSLIESIKTKDEEKILKTCVIYNLMDLSCSCNATHVIQKIISTIPEALRDYINTFVLSNFLQLCKNANGICVIKKFIAHNTDEKIKIIVLAHLEKDCWEITQDQYGNYAIQQALDSYGYCLCFKIITFICGNIVIFSNQKFASNVVDKIIMILNKNNMQFFNTVMTNLFMHQGNFAELIRNKFGLFVLMNSLKLLCAESKFQIKGFLMQNVLLTDNEDKNKLARILALLK